MTFVMFKIPHTGAWRYVRELVGEHDLSCSIYRPSSDHGITIGECLRRYPDQSFREVFE